MKVFGKRKLTTGMAVKLANGRICAVVVGKDSKKNMIVDKEGYIRLDMYNENLTSCILEGFDITSVYSPVGREDYLYITGLKFDYYIIVNQEYDSNHPNKKTKHKTLLFYC